MGEEVVVGTYNDALEDTGLATPPVAELPTSEVAAVATSEVADHVPAADAEPAPEVAAVAGPLRFFVLPGNTVFKEQISVECNAGDGVDVLLKKVQDKTDMPSNTFNIRVKGGNLIKKTDSAWTCGKLVSGTQLCLSKNTWVSGEALTKYRIANDKQKTTRKYKSVVIQRLAGTIPIYGIIDIGASFK